MPFHAIESQRIYQQIANQIGNMIRDGEYKPEHRLPPERELAKTFGVSRNVVREALVALETAGLIEIRVGAGTFVLPQPESGGYRFSSAPGGDPGPVAFELAAARRIVEGELAFQAARNRTADDVRGIEETIVNMRRDGLPLRALRNWDRLFHSRIAAATRNSVLVDIADLLWQRKFDPMFETMNEPPAHERYGKIADEHRRVLDEIVKGQAEAARTAMQEHLTWPESAKGVEGSSVS